MVEGVGFEPTYAQGGQIYSLLDLATLLPLHPVRRAQKVARHRNGS